MNQRLQAIVHGAVLARLPSRVPHLRRLLPVPITAVMAIFLSRDGRP